MPDEVPLRYDADERAVLHQDGDGVVARDLEDPSHKREGRLLPEGVGLAGVVIPDREGDTQLGDGADEVGHADEPDHLPVLHDGKPPDVVVHHQLGRLRDGGVRPDDDRVRRHQEPELGLFRFSEEIFSGDDADKLAVFEDGDAADAGPFQDTQDIVPVTGDLDADDVGYHEVPDEHLLRRGYDLTTVVVMGLFCTT